jgi:hypothetical protein
MREMRKICLVDAPASVVRAFREQECEVLPVQASPAPFLSLDATLDEHGFTPDLVVQMETLGPRSLLTGLDSADCPALLWCIDPHLNGYWHAPYARLFDLTCSTQRASIPALRECGAADVRWLPAYGHGSICPPHAARTHDAAFVGRITDERPARRWMVQLLEDRCAGYDLAVSQGLPFAAMMDVYRDSRIIPNESILGEVNFRLFEGASCGCLVLSQDLGEEQEALFTPGREFDTYADAVEMEEKLDLYLKSPRLTQAMGAAARDRVQAEHTAGHRVRRLLDYAADATSDRARGADAHRWLALAVAGMWESGMIALSASEVLSRLAAAGDASPEVMVATMRVQAVAGKTAPLSANIDGVLAAGLWADSASLNLAGSMAALRLNRFEAAKAFWYRHARAAGLRSPGSPESPDALLTAWAKDLSSRGLVMRPGFSFKPGCHLPAAAGDCLMSVLAHAPAHQPTLRLLDSMMRPLVGTSPLRVGFLSLLTLQAHDDWRLSFEAALANLKAYRAEAGLEELALARSLAEASGQDKAFRRALAAHDRSGLLAARLGA